ncbi:MAG: PAC2 family protein, partial [Angustibacter sp.]
EVAEYVETLEEAQDTADLPEASGDAIAKEFERYLRRRGTDDQPSG